MPSASDLMSKSLNKCVAKNNSHKNNVFNCNNKEEFDKNLSENQYKLEIVWKNVITMVIIHLAAIRGYWIGITGQLKLYSNMFAMIIAFWSSFGILAGAHRLWCHRSYRAKWPLRLILAVLQTLALQNDIYEWCRDHRVHHRYSETDADPHNSNRGFFFAHMGWLLCKKHPEVKSKGKNIDMSDLLNDPIVRFQKKYYIPLLIIFWFLIPVSIPVYCWNETWLNSIVINFWRYVFVLHLTWSVNSLAHLNGYRPYDKSIKPKENHFVAYLSLGEGYHNYHHTFPWDYSASEYGWKDNFNLATAFIDFFAWMGWAYDRKRPTNQTIENRINRTGDISLRNNKLSKFHRLCDTSFGILITICIGLSPILFNYLLFNNFNL